jgi:hypothetical protein
MHFIRRIICRTLPDCHQQDKNSHDDRQHSERKALKEEEKEEETRAELELIPGKFINF